MENERFTTVDRLLNWASEAGVLWGSVAVSKTDSGSPQRTLDEALRVRAELHAIFASLAQGRVPSALQLASYNGMLGAVMARFRVAPLGNVLSWVWTGDLTEQPAAEALRASSELLTSPRLLSLRLCANPDCGWVFIDESRSRNRKWCSMDECGSRAKSRRYYQRKTAGGR